ncbi:xyloglucan:xyloglucosyl transferase [Ranunculus cassubicifolius]
MFTKLFSFLFLFFVGVHGDYKSDGRISFGGNRGKISDDGTLLELSLDKDSGSGFQFNDMYLYGKFDMQIKLVPGDSAGTVSTIYLTSTGDSHDEIDFEFLGNVSGEPYVIHTNIYIQGKDDREQRFTLWFDPRQDFHTYSILWNPHQILFSVDGIPLRVFKNFETKGVPYPKDQAMNLHATIWNSTWATRGGLVQIDWAHAPFTASYSRYQADACVWSTGQSTCPSSKASWWDNVLDTKGEAILKLIQKKYMIYNYCTDVARFPQGLPPECSL